MPFDNKTAQYNVGDPVWSDLDFADKDLLAYNIGGDDPVFRDLSAADTDFFPDLVVPLPASGLTVTAHGYAFLEKFVAAVSVSDSLSAVPPDPDGPRCSCDFVEFSLADLDFDKLEDHFFDFVFGYAAPGLSVKGAAPLLVPCIPAGYADEVDLIDFAAFVLVELAAAGFPVHFGLLADAKATRAPLAAPASAGAGCRRDPLLVLVDPVLPAHLDLAVADGPGVLDDGGHVLGLGAPLRVALGPVPGHPALGDSALCLGVPAHPPDDPDHLEPAHCPDLAGGAA